MVKSFALIVYKKMFSKKINRVRDSEIITEEVTSQEVSAKRVYLKMDLNLAFFPIPICVFTCETQVL